MLQLICLLLISITMLTRANDLRRHERNTQWYTRMVGLVIAGVSPFGMILLRWSSEPLIVGITLVFLTTPGLPPWHQLIWRGKGHVA